MNAHSENFHGLDRAGRTAYLISGFINRTLDMDEEEELDRWILADETNMALFEYLTDDDHVNSFLHFMEDRDVEQRLAASKLRLHFRKETDPRRAWRYAAAACFAGLAGVGIYYALRSDHEAVAEKGQPVVVSVDIGPATEQASLTLEDGSVILLGQHEDTLINGRLRIVNGSIDYTGMADGTSLDSRGENGGRQSQGLQYNELSIPRKGFYKLTLPDESQVWLNASSSIRYPVAFNGNERRVRVTGETYFEVAKDASKPFIVETGQQEIRALGTQFDVDNYLEDSSLKATLVEGSIEVSGNGWKQRMKPSQQITVQERGRKMIRNIDPDLVLAWTRNEFSFKDAPIREVMRQVERWYDVHVTFKDPVSTRINGMAKRNLPLSKLLHTIEQMGSVSFQIDNDQILVKNQR